MGMIIYPLVIQKVPGVSTKPQRMHKQGVIATYLSWQISLFLQLFNA